MYLPRNITARGKPALGLAMQAGTGRVVVWKTFGIVNCYTLEVSSRHSLPALGAWDGASPVMPCPFVEASFAGSSDGFHFSTSDLKGLGASLCEVPPEPLPNCVLLRADRDLLR